MSESSSGHGQGWYYAQGDPPGTQRFWDGSQWVGGPQPVAGSVAPSYGAAAAGAAAVGRSPAGYGSRIVALLIDTAIGALITVVGLVLVLVVLLLAPDNDALALIALLLLVLTVVGSAVFGLWNHVIRQGRTGQTIGKERQGIRLVADATGQPVGAGSAFLRWLLGGVLGSVCFIDYLWPLFDQDQKRLTDKILNFSVIRS